MYGTPNLKRVGRRESYFQFCHFSKQFKNTAKNHVKNIISSAKIYHSIELTKQNKTIEGLLPYNIYEMLISPTHFMKAITLFRHCTNIVRARWKRNHEYSGTNSRTLILFAQIILQIGCYQI